jgi:hypothetical protein
MTELDIARIAAEIAHDGPVPNIVAWLNASWENAPLFYSRTAGFVGSRGAGSLKSKCFDSYDFYHDLVLRHLGRSSEAIVEAGISTRSATFDELHGSSTRTMAAWKSAGVEAGAKLAIVLNVGIDYAVAFLTALRMGLIVSVLPPAGPTFVQNRLHALAPDHIVSHPRYATLLGDHREKLIPQSTEAALVLESVRSFTYSATDPIAQFFSPLSATPEIPVERTADSLYLPMMRDSALLLGARSGDRIALPGFDQLQFQPWGLMTALHAGACLVVIDERLFAQPEVVKAARLTIVGVSAALRDRVLDEGVDVEGWRAWFLNPTEPYAWERWRIFSERLAQQQCPGFNLLVSAALGGALLFSPHRLQLQQLSVFPVPGEPWQLSDLIGNGEPAYGDSGLYQPMDDDADPETFAQFVIGRTGPGWVYAGSMKIGRNGQTYPEREIAALIEGHPEVDAACVVVIPAAELLNKTRVILVVFIDPGKDADAIAGKLRPALEQRIVSEMGARWMPDQVRFFPLVPHKVEGVVDSAWCRWELTSGALDKKARDELFRLFAILEKQLSGPDPSGPDPSEPR